MSGQHRATPEQWQLTEHLAINYAESNCILELRARVEALELAHRVQSGTLTSAEQDEMGVVPVVDMKAAVHRAAAEARDATMDELRAASAEARPGGLVERVAEGIAAADDEGLTNMTWNHHSRAAIREVAAWLRTGRLLHAAELLELEADR